MERTARLNPDGRAPGARHVTLGLLGGAPQPIPGENSSMATVESPVRQSVSLPARIAKRVVALAKTKRTSASRVLVDLIETGLQAKEAQHQRFFELSDRLSEATDPAERKRLQEKLARMTFAE